MEPWQQDRITEHLVELTKTTICSKELLDSFVERRVLSPEDRQRILESGTEYDRSSSLYTILKTRVNAFDVLKDSLHKCCQTGALKILNGLEEGYKHGAPQNLLYEETNYLHYERIGAQMSSVVYNGSFGFRNKVAIKKLKFSKHFQSAGRETFDRINKLKVLPSHSNIVQSFHAETVNFSKILVAMEICDQSLQNYVTTKNLPQNMQHTKFEILVQVSQGLLFLHTNGIIHCHLKPTNILINETANFTFAKISDFGPPSANFTYLKDPVNFLSELEQSTSRNWNAPEILRPLWLVNSANKSYVFTHIEEPYAYHTDVFVLGCIFYYFLSGGAHPFGEGRRCTHNIKEVLPVINTHLFKGNEVVLALITKMIGAECKIRPSCSEVVRCLQTL